MNHIKNDDGGGSRVIISVIGKDRVGIIAGVSGVLKDANVNILDISQTIMQDLFTMILVGDMTASSLDLAALKDRLNEQAEELGVRIDVQHEDVFRYMHRIQ
ncbi:ACT domain-containing protein [Desulfohalotomaculum tongense]|uniref:ACT domain-containing protein n=1 Tax=Desulforadius tongensis TaxID=1216062 RepID=UPI00195A285A|nr:ACT domain-containing protein [Desulforadius tongensis]MBM7855126.1 ACT domain-containing protein [Desulforadius tongensis]